MAYGPISSDESRSRYQISARIDTANGAAALEVLLDVEYAEPLFLPETDAAFQEILDALSGITNVTVNGGGKSWNSSRVITPTP